MRVLIGSLVALVLSGCAAVSEDSGTTAQEIRSSVSPETQEQAKIIRDAFVETPGTALAVVPLEACPTSMQEMVRAENNDALTAPAIFIIAATFQTPIGKVYVVELRHAVFGPDGRFQHYNRGLVFYDHTGMKRLSALGDDDAAYTQLAWRGWQGIDSWYL